MKAQLQALSIVIPFLLLNISAFADSHSASNPNEWTSDRPDGHAPIGVMADHTHEQGETMMSYRYMFMAMDGNRSGTSRVSEVEVLDQFMVTPTDMDMHMHMLGFMFAPRDWLTVMTMVPYVELSMNHLTRSGARFRTSASGLGDISAAGLWRVLNENNQRIHIQTGLSLPSGEIDKRDDTPAGAQSQLPYPMQLGSGTVDVLPGITYLGEHEQISWGAQAIGTIRMGENDNDYTLGNRFQATSWGAYALNDWLSSSLRLAWQSWGNIDGADPDLNPMMIPTADPNRRGGDRLDLGIGINFYVPEGSLKGLRLAAELLLPLEQDLDGPQLETDWSVVFGAQMAFD